MCRCLFVCVCLFLSTLHLVSPSVFDADNDVDNDDMHVSTHTCACVSRYVCVCKYYSVCVLVYVNVDGYVSGAVYVVCILLDSVLCWADFYRVQSEALVKLLLSRPQKLFEVGC